jgi:hypothetical protein
MPRIRPYLAIRHPHVYFRCGLSYSARTECQRAFSRLRQVKAQLICGRERQNGRALVSNVKSWQGPYYGLMGNAAAACIRSALADLDGMES